MSLLYFRYSEKLESLARIGHAKSLDIVKKTKKKVNLAILTPSPRAAFFHSLWLYLQMKKWKNLNKKEVERIKWGWEVKNGMCYLVMTECFLGRTAF